MHLQLMPMCSSKKYPYTSPTVGTGNYRGWGFRGQRLRDFKESMNLNWNFQSGGGGGGVRELWIISGTMHSRTRVDSA